MKRLERNMDKKMVCGVCAGIADYFKWDVTAVRLAVAFLGLFTTGAAVVFYFLAAFIMPEGETD